jgi:4-oxalomesaconate hydratase
MVIEQPRVLCVGAHAADFAARCAGALAHYASKGCAVKVACWSFGERGESADSWLNNPGIDAEGVKTIRRQEAGDAAKALGVDIEFLNFGDHPCEVTAGRLEKLVSVMRQFRPDLLLIHWTHDPYNTDHAIIGEACIKAYRMAKGPGVNPGEEQLHFPDVYYMEGSLPLSEHSRFIPTYYVDITETFQQKTECMRQLKSQLFMEVRYRQLAEFRAAQIRSFTGNQGIQYAEAFARFTPWSGNTLPLFERQTVRKFSY